MARQKRNIKGSRYYHLVNRGVAKQATFLNDDDYSKFMKFLSLGCARHPMDIIAFTLMPNHFHILIQSVGCDDVGKCMHWTTGMYARYFNTRYERVGHLWQNRFSSTEIRDGRHLGNTWMYVEQNPLRAGLVENQEDWKWSSAFLRSMGYSMSNLVEPHWWGTPAAKEWWSRSQLDQNSLDKVRDSLHKKVLKTQDIDWD